MDGSSHSSQSVIRSLVFAMYTARKLAYLRIVYTKYTIQSIRSHMSSNGNDALSRSSYTQGLRARYLSL